MERVTNTNRRARAGRTLPLSLGVWAILLFAILPVLSCGSAGSGEVTNRFLVGGWVAPKGEDSEAGPTTETLVPFVMATDEDRREFLESVFLLRVRGSLKTFNEADLADVVLLAAYYLWRPLRGDPLSIRNVIVKGGRVEVNIELIEDPQGHEFPYLVAPLAVVAVNREDLPDSGEVTVSFLLNGQTTTRLLMLE